MTITTDERELITRWILPDERGPQEARVRGHGVAVWILIGYWRAANLDAEATAQAYQLPKEAMEAVLALYRRYRQYIDAVPLLHTLGYDAMTAKDTGLAEAKDDEHLLFAAQQRRVLITYNAKDFHLLHDAWRRWTGAWQVQYPHSGILILPQPPLWLVDRLAAELHAFFQTEPELTNELYHYRSSTGWNRRPLPPRMNL